MFRQACLEERCYPWSHRVDVVHFDPRSPHLFVVGEQQAGGVGCHSLNPRLLQHVYDLLGRQRNMRHVRHVGWAVGPANRRLLAIRNHGQCEGVSR